MNSKENSQQIALELALKKLTDIHALRSECKTSLAQNLQVIEKQSGDFILRIRQPANRFWFLAGGLAKAYHLSSNKEQRVFAFYWEGEFLKDTFHFYHERRYPYYVECIEDCLLVGIYYNEHINLLRKYPDYSMLNLKLAGLANLKTETRNKILSKKVAALRYESFCNKHPVRTRIPADDIASYLCMSRSRLNHII